MTVGGIASVIGFGYTYMTAKRNEIKEITAQSTSEVILSYVSINMFLSSINLVCVSID